MEQVVSSSHGFPVVAFVVLAVLLVLTNGLRKSWHIFPCLFCLVFLYFTSFKRKVVGEIREG